MFLNVSMRHRKISIVDERMSFVTEVMKVFLKDPYLGDETLHRSRTVSPIRDQRTASDSVATISSH